ncbi:MAG: NAD(P)/FAD-dependent oxidoreductase [Betaproteobacteria bacterium]|nr:NAD(P)/FAD-dependent oxidoreductase [Betaproteobacteria bacterium]
MSHSHADVLVVGLGPAGAAAAAVAAALGLSVLAVERRAEIGVPVQCAEWIPAPLGAYAQADGVSAQKILGMRTCLPSGAVFRSEARGLMIDRARFDQALAATAERAGARLALSTRLAGLDPGACAARIAGLRSEREIRFRWLIAADGPHSSVAHALGLKPLETVHARQYTVALNERDQDTSIWLSGDYPGGYAWLFPKGSVANIGLGVDKRFARDLKRPLDALHRRLVEEGRVRPGIMSRTGGMIPVGGLRERLVVGSVLLVGDAAGLTHPVSGAGIAAAVISGERAGEAVAQAARGAPEVALAAFEEDVRDQFETTLARAVVRRKELERCWGRDLAQRDDVHRRGWIAFPEYFAEGPSIP